MVGKAAIGQSRQGERQWGNQVVEMIEEKNKGREIGQKREEREAETWGREAGRNAPVCWVNPGNLMQGCLSCKADSDAPGDDLEFERMGVLRVKSTLLWTPLPRRRLDGGESGLQDGRNLEGRNRAESIPEARLA